MLWVNSKFDRLRPPIARDCKSGLQAKVLTDWGFSPKGTYAISPDLQSRGGRIASIVNPTLLFARHRQTIHPNIGRNPRSGKLRLRINIDDRLQHFANIPRHRRRLDAGALPALNQPTIKR
jgi:hypothetical protein